MRFACDTGGTFTDLLVEEDGAWHLYKASTTPGDPTRGVLDALALAAADRGVPLEALLAGGSLFMHATTHAINAVLTGRVARTAFLTSEGHPDVLTLREGGRGDPFDLSRPFPDPYVPRHLTFEVPERISASGAVVRPLDEPAVAAICSRMREAGVEAVGVCLLWSVVNPAHEQRIAELLETHLPGVPYTLSHALNPAPREYRRGSAACIDASLKPLMTDYLGTLTRRLESAGFRGRVLVVTSQGGVMDAEGVARTPIHVLNSGPSMAPVAGRFYAAADGLGGNAIIADTGGTTYDVSVVRDGRIPLTRELWVGEPVYGHLTGFPSVDVKSVGAGGGSIARVDEGGMLHVGPDSAGAKPGPVCYGRGGSEPTVTDAALVLGYLDPGYFLGGAMPLDAEAAAEAVERCVARPLGLSREAAASAVIEVATENMVQAIADITVAQGIDPAAAVLIGGGGAAGLNAVFIARRLGCRRLVIPEVGAALSTAGAMMSDLVAEHRAMMPQASQTFDAAAVNALLARLEERCHAFAVGPGRDAVRAQVDFQVEARYPDQAWEIDVPLRRSRFEAPGDLDALVSDFHAEHERLFAVADTDSAVEMVSWRASVACTLTDAPAGRLTPRLRSRSGAPKRWITLPGGARHEVPVLDFDAIAPGHACQGAAIVESAFTTIVIDDGAVFRRSPAGSLVIEL